MYLSKLQLTYISFTKKHQRKDTEVINKVNKKIIYRWLFRHSITSVLEFTMHEFLFLNENYPLHCGANS